LSFYELILLDGMSAYQLMHEWQAAYGDGRGRRAERLVCSSRWWKM